MNNEPSDKKKYDNNGKKIISSKTKTYRKTKLSKTNHEENENDAGYK